MVTTRQDRSTVNLFLDRMLDHAVLHRNTFCAYEDHSSILVAQALLQHFTQIFMFFLSNILKKRQINMKRRKLEKAPFPSYGRMWVDGIYIVYTLFRPMKILQKPTLRSSYYSKN
jgi:hypothetical protein